MATIPVWSAHNGAIVITLTYNDNNLTIQSVSLVSASERAAFLRLTSGSRTVETTIAPFQQTTVNVPGNSGAKFVQIIDAETGPELQANFSIYCRSE
jgi:hypothetical protein